MIMSFLLEEETKILHIVIGNATNLISVTNNLKLLQNFNKEELVQEQWSLMNICMFLVDKDVINWLILLKDMLVEMNLKMYLLNKINCSFKVSATLVIKIIVMYIFSEIVPNTYYLT